MDKPHYYTVNVNWEKERIGKLSAPGIEMAMDVATPPQFPKGVDGIWSPEHLFTAAVNSCLMTTFLSIAEHSKLSFWAFSSSASGKLELVDGKYIMSEIVLSPVVTIAHENDRPKAERILHKSEQNCLISNSVKSKIVFKPQVKVIEVTNPVIT